METHMDLYDIQGNINKAYSRLSLTRARYIFYSVREIQAAREFVGRVADLTTNAASWQSRSTSSGAQDRPAVTTNIAFTYQGLKQLGIPRKSLQSFPQDYAMGMAARHQILGDDGPSAPRHWDPVWQDSENPVHIWISINAASEESIEERYQLLCNYVGASAGGIVALSGHRGPAGRDDLAYQDASALRDSQGKPTPREHFGFVDGISNPYFKGCGSNPAHIIGGGKPTGADPTTAAGWEPLETGEFILGYRDEACEYPQAPIPRLLSMNGSYLVYRKLHENVASFRDYLAAVGPSLDPVHGEELLAAKFAGRWRSGAPLTSFDNYESAQHFGQSMAAIEARIASAPAGQERDKAQADYAQMRQQLVGFDFSEDLHGGRCPIGSHIRRLNPRGSLEFGVKNAYNTPGALINRRRILRRGLPYGEADAGPEAGNDGDHGIIFMALGASIERQFEFVQQQWINYSNDFKLANDKDPLLGNHGVDEDGRPNGRMILEAEPGTDTVPFFCSDIPRLVETRGGDYFFLPSISALQMISQGSIDPT